jgi:methanogenic corrinoid protein MtbC1
MTKAKSEPQLLSIGDVAAATGLTPETLRMWERRYGRPKAVRLPSGHRRYRADQVRWLRRVAEALALGHRPHQVVGLGEAELDALLEPAPDADGQGDVLAPWLEPLRAFEAEPLVAAMRERWRPDDAVGFLEREVAALLRAVGRAWADRELDIRHEHYVSELLADMLRGIRLEHTSAEGAAAVLLATLAGEEHGLGLQMAALVCAVRGVPARVLGVNAPNEEIARAAAEVDARLVGISVSLANGGVETDRTLSGLRAALPEGVRLVVGGGGARGVRRGPRGVEYAESLAAWDVVVAALD